MMKKGKKVGFMVLGIAVLLLGSLPLFAYCPWQGRGAGQGGGCCWSAPGSDLSDEQLSELRESNSAYFSRTNELRKGLQEKREQMRALLASPSPDEKQVKKLHKEMESLRAQLGDARIDHILKVKKVDPEAYPCGYGFQGPRNGCYGFQGPRNGGCCRF